MYISLFEEGKTAESTKYAIVDILIRDGRRTEKEREKERKGKYRYITVDLIHQTLAFCIHSNNRYHSY